MLIERFSIEFKLFFLEKLNYSSTFLDIIFLKKSFMKAKPDKKQKNKKQLIIRIHSLWEKMKSYSCTKSQH